MATRSKSRKNLTVKARPCDPYLIGERGASPDVLDSCDPGCRPSTTTISPQKLARKLYSMGDIRVSGGPFHYQMRAGTYGETYDEAGWKVDLGIGEILPRSALEENPVKCRYSSRVLADNWVEERRDRGHIKYDNAPRLSEYGHVYKSEYGRSFSKRVCNKARDVLLKINSFPMTAHPGHQPELDIDVLRWSTPKPEGCIIDENVEKLKKGLELQKRYERHALETGEQFLLGNEKEVGCGEKLEKDDYCQ